MKYIQHTELRRYIACAALTMCFIGPALAIQPVSPTPPLVGHLPVLSPLTLPIGSVAADAAATGATQPVSDHAKVGVPLTLADMGLDLSLMTTDVDGDIENGSLYEWLIDNKVVGTATSFTPTVAHGGQLLSVRVTPKTQTGDPDTGNAVTSNQIVVRSALVDRFLKPDLTIRTWADADSYCMTTPGGFRLPTLAEFKALYSEMVSNFTSREACHRYGWPLSGDCGGGTNFYWASDAHSTPSYNWAAGMHHQSINTNDIGERKLFHVACILN